MTEEKFTTRLISETELNQLSIYKSAPIEQTVAWGEFQNQTPGRNTKGIIGVYRGAQLVASALPVEISSGKYTYAWIKNGPLISDSEILDTAVAALADEVKTQYPSSVFMRFNTLSGTTAIPAFGFHITKTIELETKPALEEIVEQMPKKKVRYVGRRTISDQALNVKIFSGEEAVDAVNDFYSLWQSTAKHQSFGIHPKEYIQAMFSSLGENCYITGVYDASGLMLAGAITTFWGNKATYYYGARRNHEKSDDASMRSVIEAIKYAHEKGANTFDMLGVSEVEGDRLAGVTTFKRKFSTNVVDYPAAYDIPLKKVQYKALRSAYKLIKKH